MIKAVISDCFGVLYNDEHQSLIENFPTQRTALRDLRRQGDYGFFTRQEYIEAVASCTGALKERIEEIILAANQIDTAVVQFITTELKPYYKIGLLSNIGRGWIENFFTRNQLEGFFDAVVLSGDEGIAKPHPRIFDLMAERLDLEPEECLMIDDMPENIAGADAAGMHGIVYSDLHNLKRELKGVFGA